MPGATYGGKAPADAESQATATQLQKDVRTLSERIGTRNIVNYKALNQAADYIRQRLVSLGYTVNKQSFQTGGKTVANLEVVKQKKKGSGKGDVIIVGAHYDTTAATPGADDNGSGVAALLDLAQRLRKRELARTVRMVFFVNEEPPYFRTKHMGSYHYAKRAADAKWKIKAMFSLETMGFYSDAPHSQKYPPPFSWLYPHRGNFIAFVGNLDSRSLTRNAVRHFREVARVPSEGVAAPSFINGIDFSDQLNFWKFDFPGVMVTDTAPFRNPNYHKLSDTYDTLDYQRLARVCAGFVAVISALANED